MLLKVNRNDWTLLSKHYVCNKFIDNIMVHQSLLFGSLINNASFVKTLEKWDVKLISLRYNKWHWIFWIYIQKRAYNFFFKTFHKKNLFILKTLQEEWQEKVQKQKEPSLSLIWIISFSSSKCCPFVTCQVYQNVNTPTNPPQNITL
jgi:hypothetical protein